MGSIGDNSIKIVQLAGAGAGSGSWSVTIQSNGDRVYTDTVSGTSFTIPVPLVSRLLQDTDGDTKVELVENGGTEPNADKMNFVVDGVVVGSVEILAGGITKWTLSGILDPIVYAGTPRTIIQRDAITAVKGYLVYISDGATEEYQYYNGTIWKALGANNPEIIESITPLTGTAPVGAKYGVDTLTGLTYYVSGGNWIASPISTVDLNTTISDETGTNGTGIIIPTTPPTSTPDLGDLHIEIYDDVKLYFTATATNWLTPAVVEVVNGEPSKNIANTNLVADNNRTHDFQTYKQTWNNVGGFDIEMKESGLNVDVTSGFVPDEASIDVNIGNVGLKGNNIASPTSIVGDLRLTPNKASLKGSNNINEAEFSIRNGSIGPALGVPQTFIKTQAINTSTANIGDVLTLMTIAGESEYKTPIASAITETQTKVGHNFAVNDPVYNNGTTWLKASAALGTSIAQAVVSEVVDVDNFKVNYGGVLVSTAHGKTVGEYYYLDQTVAGTTTATQPTTGIVQQLYFVKDVNTLLVAISNAFVASSTTPDIPLTYGRVRANLDLASTTHTNTDPGTKIPFTVSTYLSGMTDNAGSLIPSIAGRYRADWLCMAASTDFLADGIFHVVQNGVSVGQVSYNMNEASAVNQSAGFIDVTLVAGQEVSLHYRTRHTASDGIAWDRGSYFQLTQLPTAVAPIIDVVAEYGESNLAVDFVPTVAFTQMTGMTVTLPTAGTYRIRYDATAFVTHAADTTRILYARLYDSTNAVEVPNSLSTIGGIDNEQNAFLTTNYFSGGYEAVYTVGGATTIELQGTISALPTGTFNFRAATASTGGTKMTYQKIAGGLPTTGQTVDFLYAQLTSDAAIGNGGTFQFTTQSGTLTNASGVVTLPPNKIFYYSGKVGKANIDGAAGFAFQFRNLATNALIGSRGQAVPPSGITNEAASSLAWGVVTTGSTPISIRLENTEGGTRTAINGQTSMYIVQLGSTAIAGTPLTLDRTDIQGISSSALTDMFTYSGEIDVEYDTPRSAATALQFTNINASSSGITVGTNNINITKTAFYRIQIQESIQTAPGSYMQIVKNGTTVLAVSFTDLTATVISRSALWGGELFAGDVIDIRHGRTANAGNDGVKSFNIHIAQVN